MFENPESPQVRQTAMSDRLPTLANDQSEAKKNRRRVARILAGLTFLLVVGRILAEISMTREYGPDAQMAIWAIMLVGTSLFWIAIGAQATVFVVAAWPSRFLRAGALTLLSLGGVDRLFGLAV